MPNHHLFWFKQDLRLNDNPGLHAALSGADNLILIFILDESDTPIGRASLWWLHESLKALSDAIEALGGQLILRRGNPEKILLKILAENTIEKVFWNRCYEPQAIHRDTKLKAAIQQRGIDVASFNASLLFEPGSIKTQNGKPYKVFTPFWKKGCLEKVSHIPSLVPLPKLWPETTKCQSDKLEDWQLLPASPNWAESFSQYWQPGEKGAANNLQRFLEVGIKGYKLLRNRPDLSHVSRLSPHLHWGEIAPWRVWEETEAVAKLDSALSYQDLEHFFSELGWREFSYNLMFHFPHITESNWRKAFDAFPWKNDQQALKKWQTGMTGYPIVDAGMRELWQTGWMHNRVRMITASFLIKDLMIDWRQGMAWFWDTLVDADLANNSASWQWVAGSGADAAPYFRVFNPVTQGERFDPDGAYVRRWCSELAGMPSQWIHKPWKASDDILKSSGVELGVDYPFPMVEHSMARIEALAAYKALPKEV